MDVRVHGKNMTVGDAMREIADNKVRHAGRIFDTGGSADVEFSALHNPRVGDNRFRVEITTLAAGHTVRTQATAPDDRAAFDLALDKFERQLRRLKERLIGRSRKPANKALNDGAVASDEPTQEGLEIYRTKRFEMRPMTPEEAALQIEMLGHDFFFFLNANSGEHCVLYHRHDGRLGLIEPE